MKMMKKLGIIIAMATLMIAATATPSFAATANSYQQQILQARYDTVSARVGFTTGVMTDIVSLVPRASDLNAHVDRLNADLSTLSGYVSAGDSNGFTSFVSGTINADMKSAQDAMKADRTRYRAWGVTQQARLELKNKYDQRKATFDSRMSSVTIQLGNIRLASYDDAVAKFDGRMGKLSARGVDVSGMQSVEAGAQSAVISPLRAAVASCIAATVRVELKDRSLGNGAPYSYHFWAKMDAEGTKAITAKIADNATRAGYGDQIAEVNAKLAAAQSTLDRVGTSPYTAGQQDSIFNNLKAAAVQLKDIIKALGGH